MNRSSRPLKLTAAEIVFFNPRLIGDLFGLVLTENKAYKGCITHACEMIDFSLLLDLGNASEYR
eukprot:scaffold4147_cov114-Skeletonema_dohrnii-CCMP3373.AAC.1